MPKAQDMNNPHVENQIAQADILASLSHYQPVSTHVYKFCVGGTIFEFFFSEWRKRNNDYSSNRSERFGNACQAAGT